MSIESDLGGSARQAGSQSRTARLCLLTFGAVWAGQLVSIVGSSLTTFALGLWVYRSHGSITDFALVGFWAVLPRVLLSPLAGAVVDRAGRRIVMLLTSTAGALVTLALAVLLATNELAVWHVYLAAVIGGALATFEWPAWSAATSTLVPASQLGRASGLVSLAAAASDILGPILAAVLLVGVGIEAVLAVDLASFAFAAATLAVVRFPEPSLAPSQRRSWRVDVLAGFRYVVREPALASLAAFAASVTFQWGIVAALIAPMVLGFTTPIGLGQVLSIAGFGALAGSLYMTLSGGPARRLLTVVVAEAASGIAFVGMGLGTSVAAIAGAVFAAHVTIPIIAGSSQVLWQRRVPDALQGRVFAARQMIERLPAPLAYLVAGPLAERVFGPALGPGGPLQQPLGPLFGSGDGRGIGLMLAAMGLVQLLIALVGLTSSRLRALDRPGSDEPAAVGDGHASAELTLRPD